MRFEVYEGESYINTVVGDESFVKCWCEKNSYSYREVPSSEPQEEPKEVDTAQLRADIDYLSVMLGVKLL